ncbi:MAG TPA: hypothetical protein PLF40_22655, partial [Kofleriaceae bacterium]|nr:hypothetical protein [Kofleriaceae bacterium]
MMRLRAIGLCVAGSLLSTGIAGAQPTPGGGTGGTSQPSPPPDFARASELYKAAEKSMSEGKFDDAARDYGSAYEITHDSILFFKIASAQDKGGHCAVALTY